MRRAGEQRVDPIECLLPAAYVDQRAGSPSTRAEKKRRRGDRNRDPVARRADCYFMHAAHGVATGPGAAAKRREVVRAGQPVTGRLHGRDIERVLEAPRILALVGTTRERLANPVGVVAGAGPGVRDVTVAVPRGG